MAFARAVESVSTNPVSWFRLRPDVFNVGVAASARFAPGVLGLTVLVRHGSRQFRFAVDASSSVHASNDDVAITLASAIGRAFDHESGMAVVEEILVLLRSGSVPIACAGITSKTLLPLLREVVDGLVAPDKVDG